MRCDRGDRTASSGQSFCRLRRLVEHRGYAAGVAIRDRGQTAV